MIRIALITCIFAWPAVAISQTETVQYYENESGYYRYQMDVGIKDASVSAISSMPSNAYSPGMTWQSVGQDMWRGTSVNANCDAWVRDGDIGIQCYSDSPLD